MTTETATGALTLGYGLAHRGRSQSVLLRRRPAARLVGAVGRSSVGFGLAVGRSRSIRPVVRRSDLNSPMLRPPPGYWLNRAEDHELEGDDWSSTSTSVAREASPLATRTPDQRIDAITPTPSRPATGRPPVQRRVERMATAGVSTGSAAAATTSWTDQVIDRASIGYVRPTSDTFAPAPKPPDDFVASGNSKLDDLRLLVAAKAAGDDGGTPAPRSTAVDRAARSVRRSPDADGPPSPQDVADATSGARGDTLAGARTGPGHLARSVTPESAIAGTELTGKGSARRRSRGTASMGVPQSPVGGERMPARAKQPRPKTPEDRMDDLRAALIAKGLMPSGDEPDGADQDSSPGAEAASNAGPDEGLRRTVDRSGSPTRSSGPRAGRSTGSGGDREPRSDRSVDASDPRSGRASSPGLDRGAGGSPRASAAAHADTAPQQTFRAFDELVQRSHVVSESISDGGQPVDAGLTALDASAAVGLLERQSPAEQHASETLQRASGGQPASERLSSSTLIDGPAPSTGAIPDAVRRPADIAQLLVKLPGVPGSHAVVRRRVSLPRAMSFDHRPTGSLATAPDRSGRVIRRTQRFGHVDTGWAARGRTDQADSVIASPRSLVSDAEAASAQTIRRQEVSSDHLGASLVGLDVVPSLSTETSNVVEPPEGATGVISAGLPAQPAAGAEPSSGSPIRRSSSDSSATTSAAADNEPTPVSEATATTDQAGAADQRPAEASTGTSHNVDRLPVAPAAGGLTGPHGDAPSATSRRETRWTGSPVSTTVMRTEAHDRPSASTPATSLPTLSGSPATSPSAASSSATAPTNEPGSRGDAERGSATSPPVVSAPRARPRTVMPSGPGALTGALRRHPIRRIGSLPAATASQSSESTSTTAPGAALSPVRPLNIGGSPASEEQTASETSHSNDRGRAYDDNSSRLIDTERAANEPLQRTPASSPGSPGSSHGTSSSERVAPAADEETASESLSIVRSPVPLSSRIAADSSAPFSAVSQRAVSSSVASVQRAASLAAASPDEPTQSHVRVGDPANSQVSGQVDADASSTSSQPAPDPASPVNELAQRFMTELSSTIRRRPAPLPVAFQPMAEAITGGRARNVMLSTDNASRRALRSVGKVAATTDNVIHLADAPTPSSRLNEVIAHELTHIAAPSPVARFFDDADDSPEERQAERVARVMATSPLAPTSPASAPDTNGRSSPPSQASLIRRSPASTTRPSTGSTLSNMASSANTGGLSASALAASISGTSSPSQSPDVQRWANAQPQAEKPAGAPTIGSNRGSGEIGSQLKDSADAAEWFADQLDRNFDRLVNALEDRMIVEFERRGGRIWEGL